jgi:hypothetical protein
MFPIALPSFEFKIKEENQQTFIFDAIRKKYLVLTPEEWVRQHVIQLLIQQYGYPRGLFGLEKGHSFNELQKRTDIIIYNPEGKVILLVECKAHYEPINQKTMTQAMHYNLHHHAPIVVITNGIKTFCFESKNNKTTQLQDIPSYR